MTETKLPVLVVMCGLQCSGKSTKVKMLQEKYDAKVISTDIIREEFAEKDGCDDIFKVDKTLVFQTAYLRVNTFLKEGKNVIFDATNITIKSRRMMFQNVKQNCHKICYILNTPISECRARLQSRNKTGHFILEEVLDEYYKSFEIPFYEEGWSEIIIDRIISKEKSEEMLATLYKMCDGFDQKTKWHNKDLLGHQRTVQEFLKEKLNAETGGNLSESDSVMITSALYHDIGKLFTQTTDSEGQCHYYNHENVGAYELLCGFSWYDGENCSVKKTLEMLFYINYHMKLFQAKTEKSIKKWKGIFSEKLYDRLKLFEEADKCRK